MTRLKPHLSVPAKPIWLRQGKNEPLPLVLMGQAHRDLSGRLPVGSWILPDPL